MRHIVILNDTLHAKGGATGLALDVARGLHGRGYRVSVINGDRTSSEELEALGIEVTSVGSSRLTPETTSVSGLAEAAYNPATVRVVRRFVARHDGPDTIYYLHSWTKSLSASIFAALRGVEGRIFFHAHDFFLACPNGTFFDFQNRKRCAHRALSAGCLATNCDKHGRAQKLYRIARHSILRWLSRERSRLGLIAIHEQMIPFLEREGFERRAIRVIRNPSTPLCEPVDPVRSSQFLFIGRLEPEKGPDLLCAAAANAGVPLTLAGDGSMRLALERAYPQFVFPGWLTKDGLVSQARQARCLVMPSRSPEPFGLVVAEALGAGLPVLASETAFLVSDLLQFGCGEAIDPFDHARFVATLARFASDAALVQRASQAALAAHRKISPTHSDWLSQIESAFETAP